MTKQLFSTTTALLLLAITTGCSGGGSDGGTRRGSLPEGAIPDTLTIQTQWPANGETHVRTDATLVVAFDGELIDASLRDGQTYVERSSDGTRVPAELRVGADGKSLLVQPKSPLRNETWYTVHLSPTLADVTERLLEEDLAFSFETTDVTAPRILTNTLAKGATKVALDVSVRIDFDDDLDRDWIRDDTIYIADAIGNKHPTKVRLIGRSVHISPVTDLTPSTSYALHVRGGTHGVRDRGGNPIANTVSTSFTTRTDTAPRILAIDTIAGQLSPAASVFLKFDRSMDLASFDERAIEILHDGTPLSFAADADPSHRTVRVQPSTPFVASQTYTVRAVSGRAMSRSGLAIANSMETTFSITSDDDAPRLLRSEPSDAANRVAIHATPTFDFDEQLDMARVNNDTVVLSDDDGQVPCTITTGANAARIVLTPTKPLETGRGYKVTFHGGPFGVRDLVGNTLAADLVVAFYTSTDETPPTAVISPTHGHSAASNDTAFTAAFDEPLDPGSVSTSTVVALDDSKRVVPGTVELLAGNRIIRFSPTTDYTSGAWYDVTLRGGQSGIREVSGNWLAKPITTSFRVAYAKDTTPPEVKVTLNGIADRRKGELAVPQSGFELTVLAEDPINYDMDLSSFVIEVTGDTPTLSSNEILSRAQITKKGIRYTVPLTQKFTLGNYTLRARAKDMAGNETTSEPLAFRVVGSDAGVMPFERTQVVWVRFDLDRDGNGRADFEDDLYRLGLLTDGDPRRTNQRMLHLMRDGTLAITHDMFERKTNGGRKSQGSMPVIFTAHQPKGITYSELAFGGLDPSGQRGRKYGDKSTGILGRAYFDRLNGSRGEKNIGTSPGLGVFGGELFLFEAETHIQLYPMFVTSFSKRFLKVCAKMGGTPAGSHYLDATVLAEDFDVDKASSQARSRFYDIMLAADDWAAATAVILAHETGHTIGLVGTGAPPAGQHGDASLHNRYASLGDVMSAAVGYESLISLRYRFRDLNAAYIRQQVLLK